MKTLEFFIFYAKIRILLLFVAENFSSPRGVPFSSFLGHFFRNISRQQGVFWPISSPREIWEYPPWRCLVILKDILIIFLWNPIHVWNLLSIIIWRKKNFFKIIAKPWIKWNQLIFRMIRWNEEKKWFSLLFLLYQRLYRNSLAISLFAPDLY